MQASTATSLREREGEGGKEGRRERERRENVYSYCQYTDNAILSDSCLLRALLKSHIVNFKS